MTRLKGLWHLAGLAAAGGWGCGTEADVDPSMDVAIPFEAVFGAKPFSCRETFAAGSGSTAVQPLDFRFYVHDVALTTAGGERVPVELTADGVWQRDGIGLVDLETGDGTCTAGTAATNSVLRGRVPRRSDYLGLSFKVGVPEAMNHLDAARAPAPLNEPGLWWSWKGGYKFLRLDVSTPANPEGFYFHLGATDCTGTVGAFQCAKGNIADVDLPSFVPGESRVRADLAAFYAGLDVDRVPDRQADFVAGCMAFTGDPECPAMMGPFGLPFGDAVVPAGTRPFFEVVR
ncbi:MAG: hypothetical protein RL199_372 [Pseudomonadota bacterium]|jgi:uncharacterized repeat protein (TIGR04052 family)